MKTLCIVLFTLASVATTTLSQDNETITATYVGYENEVYNFKDKDDVMHEFQGLKTEAQEKHNLTDETLKGKSFKITFETLTTIDEESEEEITSKIILDLELLEE